MNDMREVLCVFLGFDSLVWIAWLVTIISNNGNKIHLLADPEPFFTTPPL